MFRVITTKFTDLTNSLNTRSGYIQLNHHYVTLQPKSLCKEWLRFLNLLNLFEWMNKSLCGLSSPHICWHLTLLQQTYWRLWRAYTTGDNVMIKESLRVGRYQFFMDEGTNATDDCYKLIFFSSFSQFCSNSRRDRLKINFKKGFGVRYLFFLVLLHYLYFNNH